MKNMSLEFQNETASEISVSPAEVLADYKRRAKRGAWWAVAIGGVLVGAHVVLLVSGAIDVTILSRSFFFIIGLMALSYGIFELYEAGRFTLEDLRKLYEAQEFAARIEAIRPVFTAVLLGSIVAVYLAQNYISLENPRSFERSIDAAGLVKQRLRDGEYWRLLTGALLHGSILHIYFNGQAFYSLGKMIEAVSNRAHVAIAFLLAALGGSAASVWLMPETDSVGASGGVLGLVGFLAVFGYRRKQNVPPNFLRNIFVNLVFIGAIGVVGAAFIDNAAHAGGLVAGAIYGWFAIPGAQNANPKRASKALELFGYLALLTIVATAIFSVWKIAIF
jgi:membrane associated rhomboid family serine protease